MDEDYTFLYPLFMVAVKEKAVVYKQGSPGLRKLCSVPTFVLALTMASRIPHHYVHAKWFKVSTIMKMLEVHGTVSVDLDSDTRTDSVPLTSLFPNLS
jgi:hypothetical protein